MEKGGRFGELGVASAQRDEDRPDWPVCTLAAPYGRVVEVIDGLSPDEQAAIRGRTAVSAYALAGHTDRTSHRSVVAP